MAQETTDIKEDPTTRMAQETTEIKEEITTRMEQETTEIKEAIRTMMEQESAEIKEGITTKMAQHMDKGINDIVKQQIEEKRKKLLATLKSTQSPKNTQKHQKTFNNEHAPIQSENTENSIKKHINENTFVHTNAVNKALAYVKQYGIVVLIGPPGIGKSRIGLELLRQISMDNERCRSIQLDDISQWQDMSDGMDAVFIDDVFGRTNCSYNDDYHSKLLEMIFQKKNVKVILTLRNNIYRTIATITERHRIFHDQHVLDLSSDKNQMTVEEKKSCLMNYLTKNKILKTDDIKKENVNDDSILDTASTVYLHEGTLQKILHSDIGTLIGFPETCYLFASHRKFTKQGHNFFCHPTQHLSNEIDNLRLEGNTNTSSRIDFTLLVYTLLNGGSVNVHEIDLDAFRTMMETMNMNPLANIPTSYINYSAKQLSGKYLKINNEGNYCFQHRLVSEAVMISYSSTDPRRVIPLLGFDFITEMARPQYYRPGEGEVIFPVPVSCYSLLALRLLQLFETDDKRKPYLFVQNLCKSKIITMTDNIILQETITQYKHKRYYYESINLDRLQFIRDHRFSGSYIVDTPYFYLPSALMMFCNIDNNSVYQCLYDSIHNTLTSESDSDVMEACKETLMESFNFAISTLDVKRSTVILKILTNHNMKQDDRPLPFCDNIVRCQGLPGLQLMFSLHDLSHVFNITSLLSEIFGSFYMYEINIDDNMTQFITSVIVNNNHDRLPVRDIVKFVCRQGQLDFVKDVCERFDSSLLDIDDMIKEACEGRNTEVIQWLMEKCHGLYNVQRVLDYACSMCSKGYIESVRIILDKSDHTLLDMKSAMNNACSSGDTELVKWLCEKFDNSLFDMKTAMNNAGSRGKTELVKWLCEKFDNSLFDMETAMNNAGSRGKTVLVKWLCEKFDSNLFDMKSVMNNACSSWGDTELVKLLCEKFDSNLFDMKTAMNNACSSGNTVLVKWLCEKFDNNLFDMKSAMNNACSSGDTELVKWFCEKFDNNLFDMKTAMHNVCSSYNTELVKWLCEKFDNNLFDMKSVMHNACSSLGGTKLVKWLCEKFDNNLFDMKSAMNNACSSGDTELVKWLCEKFDNNMFDMKTAMHNACSSYNTELVKWLCEKFDNNVFDMKSVMNNACSSWGDTELVKWLCEKFDTNFFDMKTAMNNACSSGNTKLVKWLFEKFDHYLFDMKSAMKNACSSGDTELVKWLYEKFDNSLFDMKTAMNNACSSGDTELVEWLCEKFDNSLFDMKTAMNNAGSRGKTELVKRLCEKFDSNLFDMETAMNNAGSSGNTELVKWVCENFDNNLFDMKSVMNNACSSGDTELVKWLCEKFDSNLFDMKTAMNNACSSGNTKLVKWVCEKFDNNLFDMKTAMNNACSSGNTELVKWLAQESAGITTNISHKSEEITTRMTQESMAIKEIGQNIIKQQKEEKRKKLLDWFHELSIQCDGILIDCIVDRRIQFKYNYLYHNIEKFERRKFITKSNDNEFYMQNMTGCKEVQSPEDTDQINNYNMLLIYQRRLKMLKENSNCWESWKPILFSSIKNNHDLLCRYILANGQILNDNIEIWMSALEYSIGMQNSTCSKAIAWHITKLFAKSLFSLEKVFDIWPGFVCRCNAGFELKGNKICSSNIVIVVEVDDKKPNGFPKHFHNYEIQYKIMNGSSEEGKSVVLETNRMYSDSEPETLPEGIKSNVAETYFKNYSKLFLISPSLLKSRFFKTNQQFDQIPCMQLYCRVKGIIPIGEAHFPTSISSVTTDVLEGHPQLLVKTIRIGSEVGPICGGSGTLGGFVKYFGYDAFITCAHVLLSKECLFKRTERQKMHEQPVQIQYINQGDSGPPTSCGKLIAWRFTPDHSDATSVDAAIVILDDSNVNINPNDVLLDNGNHRTFVDLGMQQSAYLNNNFVDHKEIGKFMELKSISAGIVAGIQEKTVKIGFEDEIIVTFDQFSQILDRMLIQNPRPSDVTEGVHIKEQIRKIDDSQIEIPRTVTLYNQISFRNVAFNKGDSGTCIYVHDVANKAVSGCIGMAIASHPNGGCIVTPLKAILSAFQMI